MSLCKEPVSPSLMESGFILCFPSGTPDGFRNPIMRMEAEEEKNRDGLDTWMELIDSLINFLIHSSHCYQRSYVPSIAVDWGDSKKRKEQSRSQSSLGKC